MDSAKEIMQKAKAYAGGKDVDIRMVRTRASVNSAVFGGIAGIMLGYYKKGNIYLYGLVGIFAGGIIGTLLLQENEDEKS